MSPLYHRDNFFRFFQLFKLFNQFIHRSREQPRVWTFKWVGTANAIGWRVGLFSIFESFGFIDKSATIKVKHKFNKLKTS